MENNELMETVNQDEIVEIYEEETGIGIGGVLLGAALMGGAMALFKWGKKKWADHKAKKTEGVVKFEDVERNTEGEEEASVN